MLPITFSVLGEPKSQPRVKAMRMGGFIKIYTPATAKVWKGLVAKAARPFLPSVPFTEALTLTVEFTFTRPKSHFTSKGEIRPAAPRFHTKKPDTDNLVKAVMDQLTDSGLWHDDAQITYLRVLKRYAKKDEAEGCRVSVEEGV